jgi:hypothetical protein
MVQYIRDGLKTKVFCAMTSDKVYGPSFFVEKTINENLLWNVGDVGNPPPLLKRNLTFFPNRIVWCHISIMFQHLWTHSCLITESPQRAHFLATELTKSNPPQFCLWGYSRMKFIFATVIITHPSKNTKCLLRSWKLWNATVIMYHRSMLHHFTKYKNNTSICINASWLHENNFRITLIFIIYVEQR